jgi:hypothetical protein
MDQHYEHSSDDDAEVSWAEAQNFVLLFGKFKGQNLSYMVQTKERRRTLKYYHTWDSLLADAKLNIGVALDHCEQQRRLFKK